MSLKKWKLVLASLSVALFTACAGSSNDSGSSDTGSYTGSTETSSDNTSSYTGYSDNSGSETPKPAAQPKKEAPKEVITEKTLKKSQDEASAANEDNHKLRKEIFDARTKLGLPVQQPASSDEE